jgi:hypothetical protein
MFIYNLSKQNKINFMEKFRTLKFMNRYFTTRNWRCHKRRVFFERLFEPLKEIRDKHGNHVSGYVQYDESSFRLACHEMAADISFYPFEERSYINVGEFFIVQRFQPLYTELKVKIVRTSPLYNLFFGFGEYEVHVYGLDEKRIPINFTYTRKVNIF